MVKEPDSESASRDKSWLYRSNRGIVCKRFGIQADEARGTSDLIYHENSISEAILISCHHRSKLSKEARDWC